MNADGEGRRNLTGDTALRTNRFPTWSPDGSKIAFHSQRIMGYDIYVITAEGKNLERLTEEGNNVFPAYSPDGARIAFVSNRDGDSHIYLMGTHGRNAVKLTRTPPGTANSLPSWLPGALAVNPNGKLPTSWGKISNGAATRDDVDELGDLHERGDLYPDWFDLATLAVASEGNQVMIWGRLKKFARLPSELRILTMGLEDRAGH